MSTGNELYHYGILGMKWGVRRYQYEDRSLTPAGKRRYAKEAARQEKALRKEYERVQKRTKRSEKDNDIHYRNALEGPAIVRAHTLSDDDLANAIKRLRKEAEYVDLVKKTNPGKAYVMDVMGSVGKKVIVTAAAGGTLYMLKNKIDKQPIDYKELGKAVFRGGAEKKK
jgi:hypothetical protein